MRSLRHAIAVAIAISAIPLAASAQSVDESLPGFRFVVDAAGKRYVVLRTEIDPSWERGSIRMTRSCVAVLWRGVHDRALPSSIRREATGRWALRDERTERCAASLGHLRVLHVVYGAETLDDGSWASAPESQIARAIWSSTRGFLVAEVTRARGRCHGATWAHPARARPDLGRGDSRIHPDGSVAAFRALPRFAEMQSAWEAGRDESDAGFDHWDERPDAARSTRTFRAASGRDFVLVSAFAPGSCGDYGLWALFEQRGEQLALIAQGDLTLYRPRGLVDVDADSVPEVVIGSVLQHVDASGAVSTMSASPDELGCRC